MMGAWCVVHTDRPCRGVARVLNYDLGCYYGRTGSGGGTVLLPPPAVSGDGWVVRVKALPNPVSISPVTFPVVYRSSLGREGDHSDRGTVRIPPSEPHVQYSVPNRGGGHTVQSVQPIPAVYRVSSSLICTLLSPPPSISYSPPRSVQ